MRKKLLNTGKYFVGFFCLVLLHCTATAQVGVNKTNPQQALDVNGRIQIADDLAAANTEGSIKYNNTLKDLEGYTGQGWKSLTRSAGIPSNAVLLTARLSNLALQSSPATNMTFLDHNNVSIVNPIVPAGKFLLITSISIAPSNLFDFDAEQPLYNFQINFGSSILEIRGKYTDGTLYQKDAGYAPIAVVRSGVAVSMTNYQLSAAFEQFDGGVDVLITGFLVDDLNFD